MNTRFVFVVALLGLGSATALRAAPPPVSEQPVNFYWRDMLYASGWKDPEFASSAEEQCALLKALKAGANLVVDWSWQAQEGGLARDPEAGFGAKGDLTAGLEWSLALLQTAGSKALIQIHIDRVPRWFAERHPQELTRIDPAYLPRGKSKSLPLINPDSQVMRDQADAFIRLIVNRYRENPAVKGFLIGTGLFNVEMTLLPGAHCYGYSPLEVQAFRRWLREEQGFSLKELGRRWYGNENRFRSWDDARMPHLYEFFGWSGQNCIPLSGGLSEQEAGEFAVKASDNPPTDLIDTEWDVGSDGVLALRLPALLEPTEFPAGKTVMRRHFFLRADQLAAFRASGCWLYAGDQVDMRITLNDRDFGSSTGLSTQLASGQAGAIEHSTPASPFAIRVEGALKAGRNTITLCPGSGLLTDPLFLSSLPPRRYPFLDAQRNARYVDLVTWQYKRVFQQHRHVYRLVREMAPDRQLVLLEPGGALLDKAGELAREVGAAVRATGREASYRPWCARAGRFAGFPGGMEPAATVTTAAALRRALGWSFFDGDQEMTWAWDLGQYASPRNPAHAELLRQQRLLALFAKSRSQAPALALFRSSQLLQLENFWFQPTPYVWDPGRGELQSGGIEFGYVTESVLARGLPPSVRVMLDTGTTVTEPGMLRELEKWVRDGGTFVALHNTGRDTLTQPGVWPFSRISGFQVTDYADSSETVSLEANQSLWPGVGALRLAGTGKGTDGFNQNFVPAGVHLKAVAKGCETVARWPDGSTAVGLRTLGKGRIIILGSTFWRNARDVNGINVPAVADERAWLLELLRNLGVPVAGRPGGPWLRQAVGTDDGKPWLIVFNPFDKPLLRTRLTWPAGGTEALADLAQEKSTYEIGARPEEGFKETATPEVLVEMALDTPPPHAGGSTMVPRAGGGQPGTPPVYVDIANWTRGFSFPGSFNLEPANAEEKLFLVFSLRGNGLPLDLTVSIQDVVRGHRTYQTAAGRSISLSSRDWVQYRIQLDPRENDFAGESPTPLVAGKANRISFMPPASWDAKIGNPVILGQKPFSLGPVTLERGTVTAKATQAITRQPDGVLNVDLEPFQTRVLVPR